MNPEKETRPASDYVICWLDNSGGKLGDDEILENLRATINRTNRFVLVALHFPLYLKLASLKGENIERVSMLDLVSGKMKARAMEFSGFFLDEWSRFRTIDDRPNPFLLKGLETGFISNQELGEFAFETSLKALVCGALIQRLRPQHFRIYCDEKNSYFTGKAAAQQFEIPVSQFGRGLFAERRLWDSESDADSDAAPGTAARGYGLLNRIAKSFNISSSGREGKIRALAYPTGPYMSALLRRLGETGRYRTKVMTTRGAMSQKLLAESRAGKGGFEIVEAPLLTREFRSKSYRERELKRFWQEPNVRRELRDKCMLDGIDLWPVMEKAMLWLVSKAWPEITYMIQTLKRDWQERPPDLVLTPAGEGWVGGALCAAAAASRIPSITLDLEPNVAPAAWRQAPGSMRFSWIDRNEGWQGVGSPLAEPYIRLAEQRQAWSGRRGRGPLQILFAPSSSMGRSKSGYLRETALRTFWRLASLQDARGDLAVTAVGWRGKDLDRLKSLSEKSGKGASVRFALDGKLQELLREADLLVTNDPDRVLLGLFSNCPSLLYAPAGSEPADLAGIANPFQFESKKELDGLIEKAASGDAAFAAVWDKARKAFMEKYRASAADDPLGAIEEAASRLVSAASKRRKRG